MLLTLYDQEGSVKTTLSPNDRSTQDKEVQGDNVLNLSFTLYEHVSIDVNDYVDFEGERYWAVEKYLPTEKSTVEWEYNVKLYGIESLVKRFLVLMSVDGEKEAVFTLTARPIEHVRLIVQNINEGMGTTDFKVGLVEGTENVVIDYSGKYCDEGLKELAEKLGVEWWIEGETVNLCRCEHGDEVTLGYGNGLTSLDRDVADNAKFYTRLFPIGSSRNIDPERYGANRLQLPAGAKYVDVNVERYGIIHHYEQEAFSGIYPRRVGEVSSVRSEQVTDNEGNPFTIYYFKDNHIPFDPNDYEIGGLVKHVSFQSGELAGRDFEVNYDSETQEFEIITVWPFGDDTQLPGGTLIPKVGDSYVLWNIRMPDEYYGLAEQEFLSAVNEYNTKHALDISRYKAPTDHVWVEEQEAATGSQHGVPLLHVGRRVRLESLEYFPDTGYRSSRITRISRQVTLPSQMDLEISDALSTRTLEKIDDAITDVKNYTGTLLGGLNVPDIIKSWETTRPTDTNLFSAKRVVKQFLDKLTTATQTVLGRVVFRQKVTVEDDVDVKGGLNVGGDSALRGDVVVGRVTQLGGTGTLDVHGATTLHGGENRVVGSAEFGASSSSDETHYDKNVKGCKIYWDAVGKGWMIETDYLHVNKRMYARSIQVDEVTHVGGENVLTDAACVADMVFPCDEYGHFITDNVTPISFYRVFFKKKNGEGRTIYNKFRVGDQGYCQVFNIDTGVTENFCNKYYWRLVTGTSNPCTIDEETGLYNFLGTGLFYDQDTEAYIEDYHFIDLSYSDCDTPTTNVSGMSMLSLAEAAMAEAATPKAEDPIIQFGYREQSGDDANFVAERQGATLISGGGAWKRAIVMWEGIGANSRSYYSLPSPRVVLSPNGIDMTVDTLRIKTTSGSQTIAQHVSDTLESFRIFEMETNGVPSLSIEPFRSWSTEERIKYSTPPNNAIVLNIDGRTWRFVYDTEHATYGFEEFTDPWLLAQHKTISDMLDDDVVEAKELSELDRLVSELEDEEDRVEAEFASTGAAGTGNATEDAYDAWQDAWSTLIELLTGITQETPPVYLYGYNGANAGSVTTIESSRSDIKAALLAHTSALYAWQSAFAAYRLSNIGTAAAQQAMQTAQQYIENKLDEIIQNVTDAHIDSLIEEYVNDVTKFPYTQIEANRTGLQAVTNWVGTDSASVGSAGIMTYLSQMFVGTSSISFKTDSSGNVILGEDGKPIVTSFDKAGLATDDDFASLFVSRNDLAINSSVTARFTMFLTTMNKMFIKTNGRIAAIEEGRSVAVLKADHVIIESVGSGVDGKPLSYSFYLDPFGNMIMQDLWAKNITVEGVINNLVNDIEDGDTNNDKLIPADLKSSNSNDILRTKGLNTVHSSCYCLDVLRLGDVIRITKCDRPYILLPFYVHKNLLARTATLYGGTMHRITLTEIRQLLGRKITIFVEQDAFENGVSPKILIPTILGDENNNNVDIVEDVVKLLPNNDVVLKYDNNVRGLFLANGCAVTLEFKHGYCKETRDGLEALYPIYYWAVSQVSTEVELTGWYDDTDDETWSDTFDEEEEET